MDKGLGDMNGFELAAVLKRHPVYKRIPILGTTALPGCLVQQRCLAAGCDEFISKPFGFAALHKRLTQLVYGNRSSTTAAAGL
jgi:CheY-like chemotaxis protein